MQGSHVWPGLIGEGRWMAPSGVIAAASDTGPCLGPCGNPPTTVSIYGQIRLVTATSLLLPELGVKDSLQGYTSKGLAWTPCGGCAGVTMERSDA